MKITISKTHQQYINAIASQMNASPSEVITYLLWELRKAKYQFNDSSNLPQQPQQINNRNVYYDSEEFKRATAVAALSFQSQSPQAIEEFENVQELQEETDPIILRMAQLIENF
ncbi:hypothetical protein H6G27_34255 [Nostoc linckia FACHB-104]|nr:hypothetical protein [Nostoc linckia FACHB-104]